MESNTYVLCWNIPHAVTDLRQGKNLDDQVDATLDRLLVEFGKEILQIVPGKVSTEVDARFSFDTKASVEKARHIIEVSVVILYWATS